MAELSHDEWLHLLRNGGPALAASTLERFREQAKAEGFRAGQESMRERAADVVDRVGPKVTATAIRSLPIEDETP